jgi:hypothetical protein
MCIQYIRAFTFKLSVLSTQVSTGALDGLGIVGINVLLRKQQSSAMHVRDGPLHLPIENEPLERFDFHSDFLLLYWHPGWGRESR